MAKIISISRAAKRGAKSDPAKRPGAVEALLEREGLYFSPLTVAMLLVTIRQPARDSAAAINEQKPAPVMG